jgi:hypothetical protein
MTAPTLVEVPGTGPSKVQAAGVVGAVAAAAEELVVVESQVKVSRPLVLQPALPLLAPL